MRRAAPAVLLAVAACVPAPRPAPPRHATPPARVVAPPAPAATDWRVVPLTPGTWRYARTAGGSAATYGVEGAPALIMRCLGATHEVTLDVPQAPGTAGGTMAIRTSYSERTVPQRPGPAGTMRATFSARDPLLDQIAFSRGRFLVTASTAATLYLPAWAEPARVIEDCR